MQTYTATTTPAPATLFGVDEDRKAANEDRAYSRGLEPCATCGRGVKPGSGWVVEVVGGGSSIARPGTADNSDAGYMGAWVLGPECGRHIPLAFRTKWNGWD